MNPMAMLPQIFLIRHSDTDWADARMHTGRTDVPLNQHGEIHAVNLAERLSEIKFARVFTSPLERARRTCEIAGFGDRMEIRPDLVEWDYGDYEGLTTAEIQKDHPGWSLFRDGAPDGEQPEQVAARADRFLEEVHGVDGNVAVFSSGHFIRMIAARHCGLPPRCGNIFYNTTANIGILGYEHDIHDPVIRLWNDGHHLEPFVPVH